MDKRTPMPPCTDCGTTQERRWAVDGTGIALCVTCIGWAVVAAAEDEARVERRLREIGR
jgi:hypothetical protein